MSAQYMLPNNCLRVVTSSPFHVSPGMLRRPANERLPIGIIPGGSGNSVLRDMNVVGHTDEGEREAAMRVVRGEVAWLDANQVLLKH